ncbi:MAG: DUF4296 domain-containing protein [Muribaculaceae bacterium]|nr:DUF4296 domain-containing protein [Muribaculaceae bacterium]
MTLQGNKCFIAAAAVFFLAVSCSKVPSSVIQPEEMAQLMADVHTAEGVIELDYATYNRDSMRKVLRQSVFMRHGVSPEQVDSSLAWYGRNISFYMDMYDRTIEILEHRLIESGNRLAAAAALSIAGDSVDVWTGPRLIRVNDRLPSKYFTFAYDSDPNWESGDSYTWRAKFFNNGDAARWGFVTEYDNGTVDYHSADISGDGWHEIMFVTDSTLHANRIYGFFAGVNSYGKETVLDSVQMVRKRVNAQDYRRRYAQKRLAGYVKNDSVE